MEAVPDFEDLLKLFQIHEVRAVIIGGMAFIFHAKPRFTKDLDLWVDPDPQNIERANVALADFGSPTLLAAGDINQIVQIGVAPNRIDLLLKADPIDFETVWKNRIVSHYGKAEANWIDIHSLETIKSAIDDPRHQSDASTLRKVIDRKHKN